MPYIQIKPFSNLLNVTLHFGFTIYFKNGQKKRRRWYPSVEKKQKRTNSATIMISVDGKETIFPVKLKLQGEKFE